MKKAVFILICILTLLLGGCANRQNTPLGRGLGLIEDMQVLINSDDMHKIYTFNNEKYDVIEKLRAVDFSTPQAVYRVDFDDRELFDTIFGDNISDEVYDILGSNATSIASQINIQSGITSVTLASSFHVGSVFECKAVEGDMVYFYIYEDAVVAVSFIDEEDDVCRAFASLVINENFDVSSAKSLNESLESLINCDFEVKKVY